MNNILKVGDEVIYKGNFGKDEPVKTKVLVTRKKRNFKSGCKLLQQKNELLLIEQRKTSDSK